MTGPSNQYNVLNYSIDEVFKELDPYLGITELGSATEVFKLCLNNHDKSVDRFSALR